jgi:hypothetical protein
MLGCLALGCAAGTASAQEVRPVSDILPTAGLLGRGGCHDDCHDANVCKVCVPAPAKKKISTTVYGIKCVDFCLTRCSLGGLFSGRCNDHGCNDNCGQCGRCRKGPCDQHEGVGDCKKVRTKRVLLKKVETCEVDSYKCVVESRPRHCAPACPPAGGPGVPGGKMMPPPTVVIPLHPGLPTPVATAPGPGGITPVVPATPTLFPPAGPVSVAPLP